MRVEFSFKQGCPSDFDCKPRHDCPEEALVDWPVDYLARDFESLRNALLEFSAQRYPDWQERIPADVGGMIAELMAALGDELSYVQDRYAREGYLETLSQRRSLAEFARLVDYQLDEGLSPRTWLQLTVQKVEDDGEAPQHVGMTVVAGSRVWADLEGQTPIAVRGRQRTAQLPRDPRGGTEPGDVLAALALERPAGARPGSHRRLVSRWARVSCG